MTSHDHIKLTSSELSVLFGSYLNDTLGICVISYFLEHVEDPDVKSCLEYALELAEMHVDMNRIIFKGEGLPVPVGFTEQDVNVNAPRLFSDELMLHYAQNIGSMGLNAYSIAIPNSSRHDIREHFTSCLQSSAELYNRSSNVLQEKGLYVRSPYIPYPKQTEFVHKQHFLAGWMGEQRPLTSTEISFLFTNLYRNALGSALLTGFSQIAQSKEVRRFMTRGAEIAQHHSAVFSKFLGESNLPTPISWSLTVTTAEEPVFSDKLLMFHTAALYNAGIGFYGMSMGGSSRKDLGAAYGRLIIEVGEFATDGANIMVDNGWLEKPPSAPDRKDLAGG
ncbi:DUF3231 family protein [Bacillus aerolatus]|uniref:DUF3231 family protein n=1 Tax=Bacillus aerolatus TaxID=2653354 RepID=A0A6I1FJS8_9BACI|nr:DUF3231 family protein [Bacillus aerolatus]KAB7706976.1 DUF3231 family protein [Bacillus aerolatus]